jgi:hypothetical protein
LSQSNDDQGKGPAVRAIANQQFGVLLTAAAFLFVGAIVLGLL